VREAHVTPFIALLALWSAYLGAITGSRDVLVGTTRVSRTPHTEHRIGFFVNTVAMRTLVRPIDSFDHYLAHVRHVVLEALDHEVPFDRLVRALRAPRSPHTHPLFEVMVVYVNRPLSSLTMPGLDIRLTPEDISSGLSKFDVVMSFWTSGAIVHGLIDYSAERYDAEDIHAHVVRFHTFAARALARPDARIADLVPIDAPPVSILDGFSSSGFHAS
jgi:non-ribosomal peptide synthetase component F